MHMSQAAFCFRLRTYVCQAVCYVLVLFRPCMRMSQAAFCLFWLRRRVCQAVCDVCYMYYYFGHVACISHAGSSVMCCIVGAPRARSPHEPCGGSGPCAITNSPIPHACVPVHCSAVLCLGSAGELLKALFNKIGCVVFVLYKHNHYLLQET